MLGSLAGFQENINRGGERQMVTGILLNLLKECCTSAWLSFMMHAADESWFVMQTFLPGS
ncbi:hypothetical protein [Endozoicomonas sp. SCSIO W0465]|uniref:hypothetical protein n=1 Tax=Endozoicomonas sp. SCSIO W0465 TaxID=2918516 RepID=UPI0020760AFA|nr:hypothetical protein [Endozoicomonas sp. SCSIO W0465]USE37133.1 hypothetical protein MJO57_02565 [Endozoicomonas sp. SCSIO W0465]